MKEKEKVEGELRVLKEKENSLSESLNKVNRQKRDLERKLVKTKEDVEIINHKIEFGSETNRILNVKLEDSLKEKENEVNEFLMHIDDVNKNNENSIKQVSAQIEELKKLEISLNEAKTKAQKAQLQVVSKLKELEIVDNKNKELLEQLGAKNQEEQDISNYVLQLERDINYLTSKKSQLQSEVKILKEKQIVVRREIREGKIGRLTDDITNTNARVKELEEFISELKEHTKENNDELKKLAKMNEDMKEPIFWSTRIVNAYNRMNDELVKENKNLEENIQNLAKEKQSLVDKIQKIILSVESIESLYNKNLHSVGKANIEVQLIKELLKTHQDTGSDSYKKDLTDIYKKRIETLDKYYTEIKKNSEEINKKFEELKSLIANLNKEAA
ncbi:hypothetical protein I7634_03770 [Mycoplasma mycoides subsp. capri]|uniref:hypothetical protein n=1 Tax=Mycoplasma mycoides TaxID=2102 RepID=UPI00223F0BA1|nr:hypothetical protein [Mycoplasma mycoides]QVK00053.1 hypothetical protein I7634_03770 [Mycoplasma mycoides subsp. capri]